MHMVVVSLMCVVVELPIFIHTHKMITLGIGRYRGKLIDKSPTCEDIASL